MLYILGPLHWGLISTRWKYFISSLNTFYRMSLTFWEITYLSYPESELRPGAVPLLPVFVLPKTFKHPGPQRWNWDDPGNSDDPSIHLTLGNKKKRWFLKMSVPLIKMSLCTTEKVSFLATGRVNTVYSWAPHVTVHMTADCFLQCLYRGQRFWVFLSELCFKSARQRGTWSGSSSRVRLRCRKQKPDAAQSVNRTYLQMRDSERMEVEIYERNWNLFWSWLREFRNTLITSSTHAAYLVRQSKGSHLLLRL